MPSTVRDERGAGFEAIGIVSGRIAPFTIDVNVGGGIDRSAVKPFGVWGVIGELPVHPRFRVVAEVAGENVADKPANNSALLGGAPDWEVTTGITFAVSLPSGDQTVTGGVDAGPSGTAWCEAPLSTPRRCPLDRRTKLMFHGET